MNGNTRPKDDGIIDEVAIARTFQGDTQVGVRLTNAEFEEVLRRAAARIDEESEIVDRQRTVVRHARTVPVGPEVLDDNWKSLLCQGLGYRVKERNAFNSLTQAISRHRDRAAA